MKQRNSYIGKEHGVFRYSEEENQNYITQKASKSSLIVMDMEMHHPGLPLRKELLPQ